MSNNWFGTINSSSDESLAIPSLASAIPAWTEILVMDDSTYQTVLSYLRGGSYPDSVTNEKSRCSKKTGKEKNSENGQTIHSSK